MENGNKPAMPIVGIAFDENHKGLTKREYFAAMAMQGILAAQTKTGFLEPRVVAERAKTTADAILAELDKTK